MTLLTTEGGSSAPATGTPAPAASGGDAGGGAPQTPEQGGGQSADNGGKAAANWRDSLPEDLRGDTSLAQFKDIEALAKSYIHTKQQVGKKGVIPPTDKSSDEEWGSFFDTLGRPPIDKYEIKTPEGKQLNKEYVEKYKEMAHKAGLLPKQAQAIMDHHIAFEEEMLANHKKNMEAQKTEGLNALKQTWGQGYDKQIALAKMAVKEAGIEGLAEHLQKTGLGDDPVVIKLMAKMGAMFGEDKLRGEAAGRFGGKTPAELQLEIDRIMAQPGYMDASHRDHKHLTKQFETLAQQLWGN